MLGISELRNKLTQVFTEGQADVLFELVALIYEQVMKAMDLSEVKAVIKELADAQRRTEERLIAFERATEENFNKVWTAIGELTNKVNQLAEAQRRTEERLNEFEKRTEENFARVWEAIERLTARVDDLTVRLDKLTERVDQLAEAQRRTEERLNEFEKRTEENFVRVWEAIERLTEAQRKTEERLNQLALRVDELTERLNRLTERVEDLTVRLDKLTERVDQLAEAQRRTEERLNQLALRVDELTERLNQLAEAQRDMAEKMSKLIDAQMQLEDSLAKLLGRMKTTEERIEWIFSSIGFTIEDKSLKALPELLKREGITVEGNLVRRYYKIGDEYNQLNIYGWGRKDGEKILILGEIKTRVSRKEINEFIKLADKVKKSEGNPTVFLVFVAYDYRPEIEEYLKEKGIKYFWSYELS
jgi:methyl-accepting chemotaxis protein